MITRDRLALPVLLLTLGTAAPAAARAPTLAVLALARGTAPRQTSSGAEAAFPLRPGLWLRLSFPASSQYRQRLTRAEALLAQQPGTPTDRAQARALLIEAVALSPRRAEAHRLLGELHASAGQHGLAAAAFRRAAQVDPRYLPRYLRYRLALALAQAGQHAEAAGIFVALPARGDTARVRATLLGNAAECYLAAGHLQQALALYSQARRVDAGYLPAGYGQAVALHRDGQPRRALRALQAILRADPAQAQLLGPEALFLPAASRHYHLALIHEARGARAAARQAWQAFLQATPQSPWAPQARQALARLAAPPPPRARPTRRGRFRR